MAIQVPPDYPDPIYADILETHMAVYRIYVSDPAMRFDLVSDLTSIFCAQLVTSSVVSWHAG